MASNESISVPFVQPAEKPRIGDGGRLVRKRTDVTKPACPHDYAEIDVNARVLTCRDCNVTLDPIAFLAALVDYEQSIDRKLKEARRLHDENRARLDRVGEIDREQPNVLRVLGSLRPGDRVSVKVGGKEREATFRTIEWLSVVFRASECSMDEQVPIVNIESIAAASPAPQPQE